MTPDTTETTALILTGQGYELLIAPEAEKRKHELLMMSGKVGCVNDNDESARAQVVTRALAQMRIAVDKSHKEVKAPVLKIGKLIDQTKKDFMVELEAEEGRVNKLIGNHAMTVARAKAEAEAAERKAFDDARRAREEAERAAAAAASTGKISDVLAAKQAEKDRQEALASRMEASAEVAGTKVADGVRFAWDFDVENVVEVFKASPTLCSLEIKRAAVLTWFRELEAAGCDVATCAMLVGISAFKKPVVSSR